MSNIITDSKNPTSFIETKCIFNFQGKPFESGGSFLAINKKTGKLGGILYANTKDNLVTSWDSSLKIPAKFGRIFKIYGFYGYEIKRQNCWFTYQGKHFIGTNYNVNWQDCISVREIK